MGSIIYGLAEACVDISVQLPKAKLPAEFEGGVLESLNHPPLHSLEISRLDCSNSLAAPGGSLANSLAAISQLGGDAILTAKHGDDRHGAFYSQVARGSRVQLTGEPVRGGKTGSVIVYVTESGERYFLVDTGVNTTFCKNDIVPELMQRARFLAIEGYLAELGTTPQTAIWEAVGKANEKGTPVVLTLCNKELVAAHRSFLEGIASRAELLIGNRYEAMAFTGTDSPERAFEALERLVPSVIITDGENGAFVRIGKEVRRVAATKANPVDLTGAGDMFAGVVLYGLAMDRQLDEVLKRASELAAQVVAVRGPRLQRFPDLTWST